MLVPKDEGSLVDPRRRVRLVHCPGVRLVHCGKRAAKDSNITAALVVRQGLRTSFDAQREGGGPWSGKFLDVQ